jgi:hypothetical protein
MGQPTLEILGIYHPPITIETFAAQCELYGDENDTRLHFAMLVLIEALVHGLSQLKLDDFEQENPDYGKQTAYDGALLSRDGNSVIERGNGSVSGEPPLRCVFYLHYFDPNCRLRWTYGEVECPPVEEMPERLQTLVRYSPVS